MFKSDFAREFCQSDLSLNVPTRVEEEDEDWVTHHKFKQILEMTEKTISRTGSSSNLPPRRVSHHRPEDPLTRLELENNQLRRQLELVGGQGPDMDSKFSSLASEVVRLQNTVSQMEQSKMFYESSTRKLVNILESLSSQLTGPCTTRHCPDTDSFDSVLSRRSSGHSSLLREATSTSTSSHQPREETLISPSYENLFFDSSVAAPVEVRPASRTYRRHDSLHSILPPPPPQLAQNRSRILMGSSSVRRAMSNRTANEHIKSFVAIGEEAETAVNVSKQKVYSRSKSVATGLPRLGSQADDLSSRKFAKSNITDGNKGLNKFFKQVKNLVSKDKLKKSKVRHEENQEQLNCSGSLKYRHQSQGNLTPRRLRPFQHHSTPRLIKDI